MTGAALPGAMARIVSVQFGRVKGVFGLHMRLAFEDSVTSDYTLTDIREMEQVMDSFGASNLSDLVNRKLRIRRYAV